MAESAALPETPDRDGAFPRLSEDQIETLAAHGERRRTEAGELLYSEGDPEYDFVVVLEGKVEMVQDFGCEDERTIVVHGPGRFLGRIIRNFKVPSAQAAELVTAAKELKKEGDVYSGELTEDGAKAQFRFGTVSNPKGSVKFWVKDGALAKFQFKVTGKVDFNGNEFDVDRTTTVEVKEVGTTKVTVPEEAKKKLS